MKVFWIIADIIGALVFVPLTGEGELPWQSQRTRTTTTPKIAARS